MAYVAKEDIGPYKKGMVVPDDQADGEALTGDRVVRDARCGMLQSADRYPLSPHSGDGFQRIPEILPGDCLGGPKSRFFNLFPGWVGGESTEEEHLDQCSIRGTEDRTDVVQTPNAFQKPVNRHPFSG